MVPRTIGDLASALVLVATVSTTGCGSGSGSCNASLAQWCASPSAICDWAALTDPSAVACSKTTVDRSCGGYAAVHEMGVDTGTIYYFSSDTSRLVAVVGYGNGRRNCVGGPSTGFREPTCPASDFSAVCTGP